MQNFSALKNKAAPALHFRASHPNKLHQFDFSVSDCFELDGRRLRIAAVVDDYSSALWFDYIVARDEDARAAIDALKRMWTPVSSQPSSVMTLRVASGSFQ